MLVTLWGFIHLKKYKLVSIWPLRPNVFSQILYIQINHFNFYFIYNQWFLMSDFCSYFSNLCIFLEIKFPQRSLSQIALSFDHFPTCAIGWFPLTKIVVSTIYVSLYEILQLIFFWALGTFNSIWLICVWVVVRVV